MTTRITLLGLALAPALIGTKVALTACMRKLLTILNAMARSNTVWRRTTAQIA